MSISSKKQTAGKLYRGNLGQGPGDGSFNNPENNDEMLLDESPRNQTDEKIVHLPVGSMKDNNSGPQDMNVFYGDLIDKNQEDDGKSGPYEEPDDSGFLEDAVKSQTPLKKTINDEVGSSMKSSMKQSAGNIYRGNLGQGPSDGSFNNPDNDDEMLLDESPRNQIDAKVVHLAVGSMKDNNSGPQDMDVFYGDLIDKNQKEDGISGPYEEPNDSGFLEDEVKSESRLKKAINDEAGSSMKQSAIKIYCGSLGPVSGDGSFINPDIYVEMVLDESPRDQTDEKVVRLPVGSAKDNNSGPQDMNVFYGDLPEKNRKDSIDGMSGPYEEPNDSGFLEDGVKYTTSSKKAMKDEAKKAIKDEARSSQDDCAMASTSRDNDDNLPEDNRDTEASDPNMINGDGPGWTCLGECCFAFCDMICYFTFCEMISPRMKKRIVLGLIGLSPLIIALVIWLLMRVTRDTVPELRVSGSP